MILQRTQSATRAPSSGLADARRELAAIIARHVPEDGGGSPLPSMELARTSKPIGPLHVLYEPALVVVAQGKKRVVVGGEELAYGETAYLLNAVALPVTGRVVEASQTAPFLCVRIPLSPALIGSVLANVKPPSATGAAPAKALDIRALELPLLDAVLRLVRLADTPEHAPVLAPLVLQEIVYRLVVEGHAARLQHIATVGGRAHRVVRAIAWIRKNFDQPLRIQHLCKVVGMSSSGLHLHFRAVTGMSPLQYQKTLRLQEARRLMLEEHLDAATAGFRVGYNDPSQFSREYRRQFGAPPLRDVSRIRSGAE
ncbi:AraC family transcriptional regulator [Hyalangium versicolor]|uniref:AraC family transcriptional regulator n=1 Tax=Hyalangium versicolor TaxID=2861190 RepID=UPI001CCC0383|nr:AraC family transcriptional regulator [Hyalangium versicolor]